MKFISLTMMLLALAACTGSNEVAQVRPESTEDIQQQESQSVNLAEYCLTNKCRENVHWYLKTENFVIDEKSDLYWPVIFEGKVSILPGEKLFIQGDLVGNEITNLKDVNNNNESMVFELTQNEDGLGMMLVVKNPFAYPIKFNIDMVDFEGNLHETSSCPVIAGGGVFEMWPHPIPEMVISNIRKYDDSNGMSCVY